MRFFGIDLAFSSKNPSGLCVLDENCAHVKSDYLRSDQDISDFIAGESHTEGNVIVIDAPLICVNEFGQRPCETLIGKRYGKFDASCHSSNTRNMAGQRGPKLIDKLKESLPVLVSHDAQRSSVYLWPVIETYPHPGHIEMFGLSRILKYKKGTVGEKREGLREYATLLKGLEDRKPSLKADTAAFLSRDIEISKGSALKQLEDSFDALFCAYMAIHLWHYRENPARWLVIKAADSPDFITVPLK